MSARPTSRTSCCARTGSKSSLLRRNGDLAAFRTFQKQPAWRGRPADDQLRRFLTSADRRKMRYATILAATAEQVPAPLTAVLDYAAGPLV